MATRQQTTPERRQALRVRYTPEGHSAICPYCGDTAVSEDGTDDGGWVRWRCTSCRRALGLTDPGDADVLAALDDADALDAALATVERLRAALAVHSEVTYEAQNWRMAGGCKSSEPLVLERLRAAVIAAIAFDDAERQGA